MLIFFYSFSVFLFDFVQFLWKSLIVTGESFARFFIKPVKVSLETEIVLITGGGHGIGRELALEFARRGSAKIILWDINKEENEKTANEIKREGGNAYAYTCDVSDRQAVKTVAQQVFDEIGNVTILVNNAGIFACQPLTKFNHQQITRTMEVNCMSHFWTLSEFVPRMMEMGHGHIVAMASITGKFGCSCIIPYVTSKFAVTGLMESLTLELKELNYHPDIFTTTVFPNFVDTGLVKKINVKYKMFGFTESQEVARRVVDAVQRKEEFVYVPAFLEILARITFIVPRKVFLLVWDILGIGIAGLRNYSSLLIHSLY